MKEEIKTLNICTYDSEKLNKSLNKDEKINLNNVNKINNISYEKLSNFINCEKYKDEKNKLNEIDNLKNCNNIISYYYTTAKFLKNSDEYYNIRSLVLNSRNYIPKINNNKNVQNNNYNEEYINNYKQFNNCIYEMNNIKFNNLLIYNPEEELNFNNSFKKYNNNKYFNINVLNQTFFNGKNILNNNKYNNSIILNEGNEENISNGYFNTSESNGFNPNYQKHIINDINCPPFVPSNFNKKEEEKISRNNSKDYSSKDKDSDSTSSNSDKKEEENNFVSLNQSKKVENVEQNYEKDEYLIEMFGRRGWICVFCNNFNYETRTKCNRCGVLKKPKKIFDLRQKYEKKELKENKERNNKKGDWICLNCKNLNYSFRNFCNRCKIPKTNSYLNEQNLKNKMKDIQKYPIYSFSPSFILINHMNNFYWNNIGNINKNEKGNIE